MNPPPSPITEAAGLLASGAIFPRRVGLRPVGDSGTEAHILAGIKRGGVSFYFGDAPIFHFDLEGRWQRAFIAGTHYLKGLDATVRAIDRPREGDQMVLRRRTLSARETAALDATIAAAAGSLAAELAAGVHVAMPPPAPAQAIEPGDLVDLLTRISGWDAGRWAEHQAAYRRAYGGGPPPFLPPDCPNPVILQPTAAMTSRAVADHAREVAALLGHRLNQCRDVFLAGSGWIDRSPDEVVALLGAIQEVLPTEPDQGRPRAADAGADAPRLETIHGWLDTVLSRAFDRAAWTQLRAAHLGRVTIRFDARSLPDRATVEPSLSAIKAAGIGVGVALVVDPALPLEYRLDDWVAALPLGPGDLIVLIADSADVPLSPPPDEPPPPLLAAWKTRIAAPWPPRGPRVVIYNPAKQWI